MKHHGWITKWFMIIGLHLECEVEVSMGRLVIWKIKRYNKKHVCKITQIDEINSTFLTKAIESFLKKYVRFKYKTNSLETRNKKLSKS